MPDVSLVVETENLNGHIDELRVVLCALRHQVSDREVEVLVVSQEPSTAERAVHASTMETVVPVRVLDGTGLGYYGMKDLGTAAATGEVVMFIDSDTVPQAGWLRALLEPFDDPEVVFAGGSTSIGPATSLYTRAAALSGNFPPPAEDKARHPHDRFWANNFAARRGLLLTRPFGDDARRRGQCWSLGRRLLADGITIWNVPCARVLHRPPERRHALREAYQTGYDMLATERADERPTKRTWIVLSAYFVKQAFRPLSSSRRSVGLRRLEVPVALALGAMWNIAAWSGATAALISTERRWSVS